MPEIIIVSWTWMRWKALKVIRVESEETQDYVARMASSSSSFFEERANGSQ